MGFSNAFEAKTWFLHLKLTVSTKFSQVELDFIKFVCFQVFAFLNLLNYLFELFFVAPASASFFNCVKESDVCFSWLIMM